ncbi:MAG: CRISPR-associated endonuclease Cas2 [Candidatus Sericytochromatia bacterium]|nr:CRISPR-associated endonuclease Cas2 [Candidatus Sericytochromatia bacterium]
MDIVVCYDVNTEDKEGKRRLRKVAQVCLNFGQRVQMSVFECRVTDVQYETLIYQLSGLIDKEKDSLRFYRLYGNRERAVTVIGRNFYVDFDEPLVI